MVSNYAMYRYYIGEHKNKELLERKKSGSKISYIINLLSALADKDEVKCEE